MIAATDHATGLALYTRNQDDFAGRVNVVSVVPMIGMCLAGPRGPAEASRPAAALVELAAFEEPGRRSTSGEPWRRRHCGFQLEGTARRPAAMPDTNPVDFLLKRPAHLGDDSWTAVEAHRQRLQLAAGSSDAAWVIGSAKELVESVAKIVADTKGYTIGSNADFGETATQAHKALERQPGRDVGMSAEVRSIATSAKSMIVNVNMIRNQVGTGHGRSSVPNVDEEMIQVVVDAALLWVRWALRRLEHMLIGEADLLIAELRGVSSRVTLERHLEAVVLPDQPPEVAHALGVTFAQEAAGGMFIARMTGIEPCVASDDRLAWPEQYRVGVVEGYVINRWGYIIAAPQWVRYMVGVLPPVTPKVAIEGLDALIAKVGTAAWSPDDGQAVENAYAAAGEMRRAASGLPEEVRPAWLRLADALDPVEQSD